MDVTVYGQLQAATGEKTARIEGDVKTVDGALERFLEAYPRAKQHVLDEDGERASLGSAFSTRIGRVTSQPPRNSGVIIGPQHAGGVWVRTVPPSATVPAHS